MVPVVQNDFTSQTEDVELSHLNHSYFALQWPFWCQKRLYWQKGVVVAELIFLHS
jgi:hypothetical protein